MIVREMLELQVLDLLSKKLVTDSVSLDIGYDRELADSDYNGEMVLDGYGRTVPKPVHGSRKLKGHTSSREKLLEVVLDIYNTMVNPALGIRRVTITFGNVLDENKADTGSFVQMDLFTDYDKLEMDKERQRRERRIQEAVLEIQARYGKNAILKGTNLEEGATTVERNGQIGGHRA